MKTKLMLVGAISLLLLHGSCNKKKNCSRGDNRRVSDITSANWEWFNYPEGTCIAYENNLGEKDTAVFGAVVFAEVEGNYYEKECYTQYTQQLTQDITWLHGLKGRIRPVQLISYGYTSYGIGVRYSNGGHDDFDNNDVRDTVTLNTVFFSDVYISKCNVGACLFNPFIYSKKKFIVEFGFLLSNNKTEIWQRK